MEHKKSKVGLIAALAVVVVAIGGTVYALTMNNEPKGSSGGQTAEQMGMSEEEHANMDSSEKSAATGSTVITFTNDGFDKASYTSKAGEAVTVKNDSDMDVEFSSDDHPTHRDNPELNMDVLAPGKSGTFTPPGKGTYGFHDHINDQFEGTLVVE